MLRWSLSSSGACADPLAGHDGLPAYLNDDFLLNNTRLIVIRAALNPV